ncbi:hypothetical protein RMSM_07177 [Rhodopirellula maiorica SM1]|uniref:Uncharacterized protein n=1 Tax=Rhodopirellula maiorica SM1 TaxID=1265738 RepID=M5R942_9BACT|nr:hypothetical protein RMSM_07177 [Rhodopirellula maiorica SM1]
MFSEGHEPYGVNTAFQTICNKILMANLLPNVFLVAERREPSGLNRPFYSLRPGGLRRTAM